MTKIWVILFEPVTHDKYLWKLLMCPPEVKCFALQLNISLTCPTWLTSCKYIDNIVESLICRLKVNTLCLIYFYTTEQSNICTNTTPLDLGAWWLQMECGRVFSSGFSLSFMPQERVRLIDVEVSVCSCVDFILLEQSICLYGLGYKCNTKATLEVELVLPARHFGEYHVSIHEWKSMDLFHRFPALIFHFNSTTENGSTHNFLGRDAYSCFWISSQDQWYFILN